jgi:hypothetical protein
MDSGFNEDDGAEDAVVSALVEIHRQRQRRERRESGDSAYARVLSHFEKRGQRLRGERLVTGELLDRIFSSARSVGPEAPQQEVAIAGPVGSVAVGRFVVRNQSKGAATVSFAVGDALDGPGTPALRFSPERPVLGPGEAITARVEADLGGLRPGVSVTVPVECRTGAQRARLWVVVEAFAR